MWKSSRVQIRSREDVRNLSIRRLRLIEGIDFRPEGQWEDGDWESFFKASLSLSRLKEISGLNGKPLYSVDPSLLAKALVKLDVVDLGHTQITKDQAEELFKKVCRQKIDLTEASKITGQEQSECQKFRLRIIDLEGNDLSRVKPGLIGKAVLMLEEVNLEGTSITAEQVQQIFTHLHQGTQLKLLGLHGINLSSVEPKMMGKVLAKLEVVDITFASLTAQHVQELFEQISKDSHLKELSLFANNLSTLEPELLAKAVYGMVSVDLSLTSLTEAQVEMFFGQMSQHTQLEELHLNGIDLSSIEPAALATFVTGIGHVGLMDTELTDDQKVVLFTAIGEDDDIKLEHLNLSMNDLSSVEAHILASAVHKLYMVSLEDTNLNIDQFISVFLYQDEESKLKSLSLWDPQKGYNVDINMVL